MSNQNINRSEIDLDKLKTGDQDEFAKLVDQTSAQIFRIDLRIVNDQQTTKDILQETYLKAMRALPKFEVRSALSTWLYRIAVNEALMLLREQKWLVEEPIAEESDNENGYMPVDLRDWAPLPEDSMGKSELNQQLEAAIQALPDTLRTVFILRDIQEFSIAETAQLLRISEANTKVRLLRARLRLREKLSEYLTEKG